MITDLLSCKQSDSIYDAILVIVNCYIKMIKYISANKTFIVIELADVFFEKIICWYDISKEIVSNRNSIFTSSYSSKICYQTKFKCWLSTVFHF